MQPDFSPWGEIDWMESLKQGSGKHELKRGRNNSAP